MVKGAMRQHIAIQSAIPTTHATASAERDTWAGHDHGDGMHGGTWAAWGGGPGQAKVVVNKVEESNKAKTSMDYGRGAKQAARDMRVEEERGTSQSQRAPVPKLKPPVPKQDPGSEDGDLPPEVKRNEWMLLDAYNGINAEEESKKISSKKQTQQHVFKVRLPPLPFTGLLSPRFAPRSLLHTHAFLHVLTCSDRITWTARSTCGSSVWWTRRKMKSNT